MLRGLLAFLDTLAAVGIDLNRAIYCPCLEYGRAHVCVCHSIILPSARGQRSPLLTTTRAFVGYLAHS